MPFCEVYTVTDGKMIIRHRSSNRWNCSTATNRKRCAADAKWWGRTSDVVRDAANWCCWWWQACVVNEVQMRREWWNHEKIKQKGERLRAGATNGSKYENYYEKKILCCFEGDKLYGFSSDFSYQPTMNYTCAHILHTVIQIKSTYGRDENIS